MTKRLQSAPHLSPPEIGSTHSRYNNLVYFHYRRAAQFAIKNKKEKKNSSPAAGYQLVGYPPSPLPWLCATLVYSIWLSQVNCNSHTSARTCQKGRLTDSIDSIDKPLCSRVNYTHRGGGCWSNTPTNYRGNKTQAGCRKGNQSRLVASRVSDRFKCICSVLRSIVTQCQCWGMLRYGNDTLPFSLSLRGKVRVVNWGYYVVGLSTSQGSIKSHKVPA